jgi:hypothetical protein
MARVWPKTDATTTRVEPGRFGERETGFASD